jgi:hypothetical protein
MYFMRIYKGNLVKAPKSGQIFARLTYRKAKNGECWSSFLLTNWL